MPLTTTSYAVLGLLSFGPSSGYELLKFAEMSVGYFWAPAKSHLYAELRRLAAEGYATESMVEQEQRPDKRVYAISPEGEDALRRWLEQSPPERDQVKSPFLLRVFFGAQARPELMRERVEEMRELAAEQLGELHAIADAVGDEEELFFPMLTLRAGVLHCEATITWCDEVIAKLDERSTS